MKNQKILFMNVITKKSKRLDFQTCDKSREPKIARELLFYVLKQFLKACNCACSLDLIPSSIDKILIAIKLDSFMKKCIRLRVIKVHLEVEDQ